MANETRRPAEIGDVEADMAASRLTEELRPLARTRLELDTEAAAVESDLVLQELTRSQSALRAQAAVHETLNYHDVAAAEKAKIWKDGALSSDGKRGAATEWDQKSDDADETMVKAVDAHAEQIIRHAPHAGFQTAVPDHVVDAAMMFWQRFPHVPREGVVRDAADTLRTATDPRTPAEAKLAANHSLAQMYLPALQRTAQYPERWAKQLQPIAGDLSAAISAHLDRVTGKATRDAALAFAADLKAQARVLAKMRRQKGADRLLLSVAAPHLVPKPK